MEQVQEVEETIQISSAVKDAFLEDARTLSTQLVKNPQSADVILQQLIVVQNAAKLIGFDTIFRMCVALRDLYLGIADGRVKFNQTIAALLKSVSKKMLECCSLIESEESDKTDIQLYVTYCDKASANEIFEPDVFAQKTKASAEILVQNQRRQKIDKVLQIHSQKIDLILNSHEEMIARSYKVAGLIDSLKTLENEIKNYSLSALRKQLATDFQTLQNELQSTHEEIFSLIKNDAAFVNEHQEGDGFFVFANGKKYLIPGEFIVDVTYETSMNYVNHNDQLYYVRMEDEVEVEIPIYFLSSLFPGNRETVLDGLDTILIAEYQDARLGIVVDYMQTFISTAKKSLPPAYSQFHILQGFVFDEKYDIIPILHVPEILKKFRALRTYDVKTFEANTKHRTYRIIVVDDSETIRQIEKTILRDFIVEQAYDGINAMEKIRASQYDLVLTDDEMPRMSGEVLIDNLRLMENYKNVPVIAVASSPIKKANAFINKSDFKRTELIRNVKELLNE